MSYFRHVGLVVDDMEGQINFYSDFFGFVVQRDMFEEGSFFEHLLGVPNIKARTVKMSDETGNIVLELLDFEHACFWRLKASKTRVSVDLFKLVPVCTCNSELEHMHVSLWVSLAQNSMS